jgi:hypothetical protein
MRSSRNIQSREPNSYFVSEMLRRLMVKLAAQAKATDDLTRRIKTLKPWLLWVTVAIGALTLAQVLIALGIIGP